MSDTSIKPKYVMVDLQDRNSQLLATWRVEKRADGTLPEILVWSPHGTDRYAGRWFRSISGFLHNDKVVTVYMECHPPVVIGVL